MKNSLVIFVLVALAIALCSSMVAADPSYFGTTGNILTPNDVVLAPAQFTANYNQVNLSDRVNFLGASFGVTPGLELGVTRYESDVKDSSVRTALNLKYSILKETATAPSFVIGAIDAGGSLSTNDDPGLYVVLGKNLTPVATNVVGEPMKPLRGYLGWGMGIYDGPFLAINCAISPKADIVVEYINKLRVKDAIDESAVFNAGLRLNFTEMLHGNVSLINGKDLGFGISINKNM